MVSPRRGYARSVVVQPRHPRMIVSGGQTGADRGALDAAIAMAIAHGGWCPRGRRAEDGMIPAQYGLRETESEAYEERTLCNVLDSDATLLVTIGPAAGGSALTAQLALEHGRPLLQLDLQGVELEEASARVREWLAAGPIDVLNVAGPRESEAPGIGARVYGLLIASLAAE